MMKAVCYHVPKGKWKKLKFDLFFNTTRKKVKMQSSWPKGIVLFTFPIQSPMKQQINEFNDFKLVLHMSKMKQALEILSSKLFKNLGDSRVSLT